MRCGGWKKSSTLWVQKEHLIDIDMKIVPLQESPNINVFDVAGLLDPKPYSFFSTSHAPFLWTCTVQILYLWHQALRLRFQTGLPKNHQNEVRFAGEEGKTMVLFSQN